jgi:hypothetical protein
LPRDFQLRNCLRGSYPQQVAKSVWNWTVSQELANIHKQLAEVIMKTIGKAVGILALSCSVSAAVAAPRSMTLTNQSGSAITSITAVEKTAPDTVLSFMFSGDIANLESDSASIDLPEGVCVVDMTYTLASGENIIQQNVDLCSIDGVIVE